MTELPETVRREIEDLPRHYRIQHQAVRERVVLTARVCGVPVMMYLDAASYPSAPPELEVGEGWTWEPADGRRIRCLDSQARWNRTLGLGALLRELERRFRDLAPVQDRRPDRQSIFARLKRWLRRLRERFQRRRPLTEDPSAATGAGAPRELYDRMIRDNTARVQRYQGAVAQLVTQWQHKAARLEAQRAEIQDLKEREGKAMEAAGRIVDELRAASKSTEEIRADAEYCRIRSNYEQCSAELAEAEERAEKLEADAEEHLGKIERHEAQLEKLMDELEDLKEEAAEFVTDMTLVQLEKEIVDVRAGISHATVAGELRELRQRLRKERAIVRVTRETLDDEHVDELYLEVADKVSAARELEQSLGLEGAAPRPLEPEKG
jgi:chromosome segregation ATPase